MDLSLGFLFWSIDLYICLCANTIPSWWLWLCSIVWSQADWFLQLKMRTCFKTTIYKGRYTESQYTFEKKFNNINHQLVQLFSRVQLFVIPWTAAHQASLSITNSWSLLKLMSIELVMPSNHLIFCCPLSLLPSIFPSIRVFSDESVLHIRWPKYWSFSFSISPSNEYSGLISFRMDWLDLLTVQGTLKSLLQHHSSKASILWCSVFFTIQLSHPYITTGKTVAVTRWTFVSKVKSLIF